MKDLTEKTKSTKKVYNGRIISLYDDTCILPNGKEAHREVVRHPGAVAILAIKDGNVILVEQYRYPISKITWEVPAGKIDAGELPDTCASRELQEETGMSAAKMQFVFTYYTTPGFSDETMHLYFAEELEEGQQNPDEDEFVNVISIPFKDALAAIGDEKICDAKTILALLWYEKHIIDNCPA